MFDKNILESIKQVSKYWCNKMPMLTMEESGELIQAISKVERTYYNDGMFDTDHENMIKEKFRNLTDEIGDMYISLKALEFYYQNELDNLGIDIGFDISENVKNRIEKKLMKKY